MEIGKGVKTAGVLSEETWGEPILYSLGLLVCTLYTSAKRMEIENKLSFQFFSYPKLKFPQKEKHFMHTNLYAGI